MHLKKEEIARLAHQIGENLKKSGVVFKVEERRIVEKVETVIQKNVDDEHRIEDEVKKLMEQYRAQIATGSVDPQKVYMMIKKQVAKDRKFIL
ncbi:MAG: DUF507 family protein [Deltaproteobacteria bacterium]|nr:DUF507 family protein [Deltaproteobacteria bacterium]MBI2500027.1 DUF507 family protein [Deltaproteobacteria bacterium]MBI4197443.1 DUF507 family protein [Deltaproteobacteria bacterium]